MKKINMDKIGPFILPIFFIVGIIYVQTGSDSLRKKRAQFMKEQEFAIGILTGRGYSSVMPKGSRYVAYVSFRYNINGEVYESSDMSCYLDSPQASTAFKDKNVASKGDRFLVVYNGIEPKQSIIRLDYPIKDSTDFRRYVEEIERERKGKRRNMSD